jgi:hypothetical protein
MLGLLEVSQLEQAKLKISLLELELLKRKISSQGMSFCFMSSHILCRESLSGQA